MLEKFPQGESKGKSVRDRLKMREKFKKG